MNIHDSVIDKAFEEARVRIPAHLDADQILANSWDNTADITDKGIYESVEENVTACFHATVDGYIDQDCSSY